jgi:hypothetical protein
MLVTMSRDPALRVSLQALHASRGTGVLDLRVSPPRDSADPPLYVARDLLPGALAPRPPETRYSKAEWGVDVSGYSVEVVIDNSVSLAQPWDRVLDQGGLDTIEDEKGYALVLVGARPGLGIAEWWHKAAISVVPADP